MLSEQLAYCYVEAKPSFRSRLETSEQAPKAVFTRRGTSTHLILTKKPIHAAQSHLHRKMCASTHSCGAVEFMKPHLLHPQPSGLGSPVPDRSRAHAQPFPPAEHGKISFLTFWQGHLSSQPPPEIKALGLLLPPCPLLRMKLASREDTRIAGELCPKHCTSVPVHLSPSASP